MLDQRWEVIHCEFTDRPILNDVNTANIGMLIEMITPETRVGATVFLVSHSEYTTSVPQEDVVPAKRSFSLSSG